MQIEDIFEEPLVVSADSSISKAVAKMLESRSHEALAMDDDGLQGVLSAADMVKTNISNPGKSSIKPFLKQISPIHSGAEPGDILNTILVNECRSIPVEKDGKIFVVSKLSLLKFFRDEIELKGKTVNDVMNFPFCVSSDDSISTARALMRDMNVGRLAVVDEKDRVAGVLDTLDLLRSVIGKRRAKRGEEIGEKIKLDDLPVKSILSKDILKAEVDTPLIGALEKMTAKNASSFVVERKGKLAGLVTVVDILKLISGVVEGVRVTISGMQDEDDFIKSVVSEEIEHAIKKLAKILPLSYFVMHVRTYHKTGKRVKYSVQSRLITEKGDFFADDYAWDLTKATKGVLAKIEKEVIRHAEKAKVYGRGP